MTKKPEKLEKYETKKPEKKEIFEIKERKPKKIVIREIKKFPEVDFRDKKPIIKKKSLEEIEQGMHSEIEPVINEKFSPVSEKITTAPRIVNLERGVSNSKNSSGSLRKEEDDNFSYTPKREEEKTKYMPSMEHAEMPKNLNPSEIRNRFDNLQSKKVGFMQSESSNLVENVNYERYTPVKVKELQEDIKEIKDKALKKTMKYETSR